LSEKGGIFDGWRRGRRRHPDSVCGRSKLRRGESDAKEGKRDWVNLKEKFDSKREKKRGARGGGRDHRTSILRYKCSLEERAVIKGRGGGATKKNLKRAKNLLWEGGPTPFKGSKKRKLQNPSKWRG